ncbi:MAG: 30S ribosomal protein S15 [Candidatus Paraimprobicoccus trichonymphae]|uniref:Small ribosomal subunit protein uS15 n=1 Tax=Candidatus Paraimprobicoccus trichonymphae TaxID=3033793 RepID=A0AA48HZQ8_9FIRM|nr:MAG: 30S ribosomal protein S15 [Candidatus Paraimprobicoccus trichonymphae]
MVTKEDKKEIIKKNGKNELDTGSSEVQIELLTKRINYLTDHLKTHKKDKHSRRGLLMIVGKRRRLLNYSKKSNLDGYKSLISRLGIRK